MLGFVLIFSPSMLVNNVHFGVAPTWADFFLAIPVAMIAYTGIETISNLSEEARDPSRDIPNVDLARLDRGVRHLLHAPGHRALRAARDAGSGRRLPDALGLPPEEGGYANDPVLGLVDNMGIDGARSTAWRSTSGCWRRRSCSSRPTPA